MKLRFPAILMFFFAAAANAAPPPITDAEKAACEIVADHLARGPVAIVEKLAPDSPFLAIGRSAALEEVEARTGPAAGATWVLRTTSDTFAQKGAVFHVVFPSGVEDVVTFEMVRDGATWKVRKIATLVDGTPQQQAANDAAGESRAPSFALLLLAPILAIAGAILRRPWPRMSSAVLILALVCFALPIAQAVDPDWRTNLRRRVTTDSKPPDPFLRLGALVPLRRAAAAGGNLPPVGGLTGVLHDVAVLWKLQLELGRITPEAAGKQFSSVTVMAKAPLACLLRARSAAAEGKDQEAIAEYAAAATPGAPHDTFELEERFVRDARFSSAVELRNRDVWPHYTRAADLVIDRNFEGARKAFREAWRIQPIARGEVISAGVFALLLRDPTFAILMNLNTPEEERRADSSLARSPMRVPAGTKAVACGMFVRLKIADGRLDLPGGAAIAPEGTQVVGASDLDRDESEALLARVAETTSPDFISASGQRLLVRSIDVLADHNRWNEIEKLTEGITPHTDNIPASLVLWRVRALLRARRSEEAKRIATGIAMTHALQRSPDVATMIEASSLLEKAEAWNDAEEMLKGAASVKGAPDVGALLRRLELRRQLATSIPVVTTSHFAIHTTPDVPSTVAERIGQLLESELTRVSAKLHSTGFTPVRVNVLHWDDFADRLTFSDHILGFYDGEITIPFGDVSRFRDSVVAVLTHEMTHAVVSQATSDNAPHWFQEGLAQRMELLQRQENVFQLSAGRPIIAMSLVDATMRSSVDPLAIAEAYLVAQTFIRFLEDRYGSDSILRLMASFNDGKGSDEALVDVTGKPMTELDREFRTWGTTHSSAFLDSSPWPYTSFYSLGIDPAVREGIRFSRPKP